MPKESLCNGRKGVRNVQKVKNVQNVQKVEECGEQRRFHVVSGFRLSVRFVFPVRYSPFCLSSPPMKSRLKSEKMRMLQKVENIAES